MAIVDLFYILLMDYFYSSLKYYDKDFLFLLSNGACCKAIHNNTRAINSTVAERKFQLVVG